MLLFAVGCNEFIIDIEVGGPIPSICMSLDIHFGVFFVHHFTDVFMASVLNAQIDTGTFAHYSYNEITILFSENWIEFDSNYSDIRMTIYAHRCMLTPKTHSEFLLIMC